MEDNITQFAFSRQIKLSPALGDWTTLHYKDDDYDSIKVSPVYNINFDSFPRDQMKEVHYFHYFLAEKIVRQLSKDMTIKVELHTVLATQVSYQEFIQSQVEKIVQSNYSIQNIGTVNFLFDWSLADMMINRLVGGAGKETKTKKFNPIEMKVLEAQMKQVIPYFRDTWQSVLKPEQQTRLDFYYGKFYPDKRITLREAYVMFSFYLYFGKGDLKKISIAYPNPVLRRLYYIYRQENKSIEKKVFIYPETESKTKFPVKVVLGKTALKMRELSLLQPGDVIPLNRQLDEPLDLQVCGHEKFKVQPGVKDNNLCVQVLDLAKKSSDNARLSIPTMLDDNEFFDTTQYQTDPSHTRDDADSTESETVGVLDSQAQDADTGAEVDDSEDQVTDQETTEVDEAAELVNATQASAEDDVDAADLDDEEDDVEADDLDDEDEDDEDDVDADDVR